MTNEELMATNFESTAKPDEIVSILRRAIRRWCNRVCERRPCAWWPHRIAWVPGHSTSEGAVPCMRSNGWLRSRGRPAKFIQLARVPRRWDSCGCIPECGSAQKS